MLVVVGSTRRRKKPLHKKRENMTETKLIYLSFLQNLSIRRHRRRKATAQRRFRRRCYNKARLQFSGRPETISLLSQSIGRVRGHSRKRNFYWFHFFSDFRFFEIGGGGRIESRRRRSRQTDVRRRRILQSADDPIWLKCCYAILHLCIITAREL